jgi:hypothetical protein
MEPVGYPERQGIYNLCQQKKPHAQDEEIFFQVAELQDGVTHEGCCQSADDHFAEKIPGGFPQDANSELDDEKSRQRQCQILNQRQESQIIEKYGNAAAGEN